MPTFGSLFAGVGGFDMGFEQSGFRCQFQVEWDKHCQSVLNRHWPDIPKWGDVCDVNGAQLPPVDVLIFGSPCQDLSVAGKRAGIDGGRSSMFFEAIRIIKEMQHATGGKYPRAAVWENVPGALSSNKGADFQAVLNEMADCGSHLTEWAVLDAQHFGVPQRRRRIFLVAVLDPRTADKCPNPLFPVAEGRRGDYEKGIPKGKAAAGTLGGGSGSRGWSSDTDRMTFIPEVVGALQARMGKGPNSEGNGAEGVIVQSTVVKTVQSGARDSDGNLPPEVWQETDLAPTLNSMDNTGESRATVIAFTAQRVGEAPRIYEDSTPAPLSRMGTGGNNTPMIVENNAYSIREDAKANTFSATPTDTALCVNALQPSPQSHHAQLFIAQHAIHSFDTQLGIGAEDDPSYTIDTTGAQSVAQPVIAFATNQRAEVRDIGDTSVALAAERGTNQQTYLAQPIIGFSAGNSSASYGVAATEDGTPPLRAGASGTNQVPTIAFGWQENHHAGETHTEITTALTTTKTQAVHTEYAVRRLTPLECERLMGWPDDHTRWRADGTEQSDSARYKQCGNGVATPVARWVAEQIGGIL